MRIQQKVRRIKGGEDDKYDFECCAEDKMLSHGKVVEENLQSKSES